MSHRRGVHGSARHAPNAKSAPPPAPPVTGMLGLPPGGGAPSKPGMIWQTTIDTATGNSQGVLIFNSAEALIQFLQTVVKVQAERLGVEVSWKRGDPKATPASNPTTAL